MDNLPFEDVFRTDGVELRQYDGGSLRVAFFELCWIERRSHMKISLKHVLQRRCLCLRQTSRQKAG